MFSIVVIKHWVDIKQYKFTIRILQFDCNRKIRVPNHVTLILSQIISVDEVGRIFMTKP